MERLTERYGEGYEKTNIFGKVKCQHRCNCDTTSCNDCKVAKQLEKLGEYKDKIKNGTLVEVVRCKDCKYLSEHGNCTRNMCWDEAEYAYHTVMHPDEDAYCSYGVKKQC